MARRAAKNKLLNAENMTDGCDVSAIWNSSSANYSATPKKRRCNVNVSWRQFMKSKDIIPLTRWTSTVVTSRLFMPIHTRSFNCKRHAEIARNLNDEHQVQNLSIANSTAFSSSERTLQYRLRDDITSATSDNVLNNIK